LGSEFRGIPPQFLDKVLDQFPEVWALGRGACAESGDYDFRDDIMPDIRTGTLQLWLGRAGPRIEFLVVTRIEIRPLRTVGQILIATGQNRKHWLPSLGDIEEFFRERGATACEAIARKGWQRELSDYDMPHVVLRKGL
jgi:hypothetical protein